MSSISLQLRISLILFFLATLGCGLANAQFPDSFSSLSQPRTYTQKRVSSYDRSGGNEDYRKIAPGETLILLDEPGPGLITHIWFTIADDESYHLKKLVLRMYWDGEATPSVEAPLGDFFGLGLGDYFVYESAPLTVAPDRALNSFFPMPFQKHARITVTNEGHFPEGCFYFNIDYRCYDKPLAGENLYFHAQYRQAAPNQGFSNQWKSNGDKIIGDKKNPNGEGNYVWMEATGRGHFVGVTMSVLQNQDDWWGEGDDMFFIDGETSTFHHRHRRGGLLPGRLRFRRPPVFITHSLARPWWATENAGSRSSVYRFHLDSPIPFTKSFKATIEHGHANDRSDNYLFCRLLVPDRTARRVSRAALTERPDAAPASRRRPRQFCRIKVTPTFQLAFESAERLPRSPLGRCVRISQDFNLAWYIHPVDAALRRILYFTRNRLFRLQQSGDPLYLLLIHLIANSMSELVPYRQIQQTVYPGVPLQDKLGPAPRRFAYQRFLDERHSQFQTAECRGAWVQSQFMNHGLPIS